MKLTGQRRGGRAFQSEGLACAKVLWWERVWHRSWECKEVHEAGEAEAKSPREQDVIFST